MKTRIIIVALMLCTGLIAHAQVELTVQQLAENEHIKFASELPDALAKGKIDLLGNARAVKKQFFLEENAKTFADFFGWDNKKYTQKTISKVFKELSEYVKSGRISVKIDFPVQPSECIITMQKDKRGTPKTQKRETVTYVATTKADVMVEANKQGVQTSTAHNNVALIWDGKVKLINGVVDDKKTSPPILRSIVISAVTGPKISREERMRARAIDLIEEYYRNLRMPTNKAFVLTPEIPNKAELEFLLDNSTRLEINGSVNVHLPAATSQTIELRNVPAVKIHVDPVPYMKEDVQYSKLDAYHQFALTFTVDFQADKITKVVYDGKLILPEPAPKPVFIEPEPVRQTEPVFQPPVPSRQGEYYKVQILFRHTFMPFSDLPEVFRVPNLTVEKYTDGDNTYYKYVVPTKSLSEAFAIRDRLVEKGIDDAWIAVYEDDVRIRPLQGRPETVKE